MKDKWDGLPLYDRPLGSKTDGVDDGRPVVTITDFSACQPADALAEWSLVDYETDDFSGKLLHAGKMGFAATAPPELTLDLNVSGYYAVYVWLMGGDSAVQKYRPHYDSVHSLSNGPALRLSDDKYPGVLFRTLSHDLMFWPGAEACFWKYADLTDQKLHISYQGSTVHLAAIQLVPLSPTEVEAIQKDRASAANKRLIIKGDTYDAASIRLFHDLIKETDVFAWIAGCNSTADLLAPGGCESLKRFRKDMTELGVEAYVCERIGLWSGHTFRNDQRFLDFDKHPEWHCRDRDGADTHQASYAHPEVQEYMLQRARAAAETGIDGYGYLFCRDPGLILFEPIAMEGFEEKHGVDPCTLNDRDDRLLDWRADIITDYLRRLRKLLDDVAEEKGFDRIKIVHVVLGDEAANRFFSFDVPTWVKEGLVDVLCPYPWADYPDRWLSQGFVDVDVKYFTSLVKGTDCKVYPMWLTAQPGTYMWSPENVRTNEYFKKAMKDYADGADGISTWDFMCAQLFYPFKADRWLRLGHKEQLSEWQANDFPLPPKLRFTKYAGKTPDRYPPGTGG